MVVVKDMPDIIDNISTFEGYLKDPKMQEFAISLIKDASSFVAVKKEKGYKFYPSRFVGHKNNSYDAYQRYNLDSGRDTIEIISQILKHKPNPMKDVEAEFRKFCQKLGFTAPEAGVAGAEHQYWIIGIAE
jgi:hypothetical protein